MSGTDAASFSIVAGTGQLQTKIALDYETKRSYTVTITAADGRGGTASINVTINVSNVEVETNSAPEFTDGTTTTRSIIENTNAGENIGTPVAATDSDRDTLTYTLGGTDAASFTIVSSTGQLQTKAPLDYETKRSYTVTITVSDRKINGSDTITVTINVMDQTDENRPPVFTAGDSLTITVNERLQETFDDWLRQNPTPIHNLGSPLVATDMDNDTLTYSTSSTGNALWFSITSSGQINTNYFLDHEWFSSVVVIVTVSDGRGGMDTISVTINITDLNEQPYFGVYPDHSYSGDTIVIDADNGTPTDSNIGDPVTGGDDDANSTLSYSLSGTDASAFNINSSTAQITNNNLLNINTKSSYAVVVTVSDGSKSATINVTINVVWLAKPPVANRSPAVRTAIVNAISGIDSAADVTAAHLSTITDLDLSRQNITALSAGDFNDLTNLTALDLDVNYLTSLPDGILDHLTKLQDFTASGNNISSLNGNLFRNNSSLQAINLNFNNIRSFGDGLFTGLTGLFRLTLRQNNGNVELPLTLRLVDDEDNDPQTAKYEVYARTAVPEDIALQVWSVHHGFYDPLPHSYPELKDVRLINKHADVNISAGKTTSNPITFTRHADHEDSEVDAENPAIYLAIQRSSVTSTDSDIWGSGYDYSVRKAERLLVIPEDTSGAAPAIGGKVMLPESTALLSNFPNPFNPDTWIPYQLNKLSDVSITIYDIRGNVVRTLDLGHQRAGYYTDRSRAAHWDGRNAVGEPVANGVYFYQLKAGDYSYLRKMLIVK